MHPSAVHCCALPLKADFFFSVCYDALWALPGTMGVNPGHGSGASPVLDLLEQDSNVCVTSWFGQSMPCYGVRRNFSPAVLLPKLTKIKGANVRILLVDPLNWSWS